MCKVAQDFDADLKQAAEHTSMDKRYNLPGSDTPLILKDERIRCPELLFQPGFINKDLEGIHKYTFDSIMKCDQDIKKDLF